MTPTAPCKRCGRALVAGRPALDGLCDGCRTPVAKTQVGLRRPVAGTAPPLHPQAPVGSAAGEFSKGQAIGAYVVETLLGDGPTSSVYMVRDARKRALALKIVHDGVPGACLRRFEDEVATLKRVRHPGLVPLQGSGTHAGRAYLVREYLQGRSLQEVLDEQRKGTLRRWTFEELLSIFRQLGDALEALHASSPRTIHRHLMPAHVMLVRPLRAVLVGCGLVFFGDAMGGNRGERGLGTPAHMAPEQLEGGRLDERTDMFALGLLMYELATLHCPGGKGAVPPWTGQRIPWQPARPTLREPALPRAMEDAILSCLEVDTLRRCRSTVELASRLSVPALDALLRVGQLPARRITDEPAFEARSAAPRVVPGARPAPEVLARLAPYEIEELVSTEPGQETYRARHAGSDRPVLVRIVPLPEDRRARAALGARIEKLADLQDPRIVPLVDVGYTPTHAFAVFPFTSDRTLASHLEARGILSLDQALTIFADLLGALESCDARLVRHGDIRPVHVIVSLDGHARLTGFPLVPRSKLTGVTGYVAPEQLSGDEPDRRTDLYALGLVLHEMLAGKPAFSGQTVEDVCAAVLRRPAMALRFFNADCPEELSKLVLKLLEKNPEDRYQTFAEIKRDLAAVRALVPVPRRKGSDAP